MIQIQRKQFDEPVAIEVHSSTLSYAKLAEHVGYNVETDTASLTVSIDGGRKNSVLATDEMTVVDGQMVQIDW